ncbi:MAG TPA: hypothetical protein PLF42_02610, partial [Anaerolineales bacterium]|nr:hypothetical protein [Anaerolineales bacterium]
PTNARVFGDVNDPESPVSKAKQEAVITLRLREELSTNPLVFYIPPTQSNGASSGTQQEDKA